MRGPEQLGPYTLCQPEGVFPLGEDALALGSFATVKRGWRVCDLGTGSGCLLLLLAGREEELRLSGVDRDPATLEFARTHGVADYLSTDAGQAVSTADVVYLCLHPRGIVDFLSTYRACFRPGALVTDVCGIKTAIVDAATVLPDEVDFIGSHPMAGKETSGIFHADGALFRGAHYIITPRPQSRPEHVNLLHRIADHIGCRDVVNTTTAKHDAIIAYTSQVMHIIAVSVCDDPMLFTCKGFEGSSFRGCTRVAALDVPLWTQLFSLNAPALTQALETLEDNLRLYRQVIQSGDTRQLADKLAFSAARKRKMNQLEAERGDTGRGA